MFKEGRYQFINVVDICYATDIIKYDRRTSDLSNEPLHITQDANSIEKYAVQP